MVLYRTTIFRSVLVLAILVFAAYLRIHNAFFFNPYWGYDGGAHLTYIETLAQDGRLPTMQESYVAWHEPLYYMFMAWWWRVSAHWIHTSASMRDMLSLVQAIVGMIFVVLAYRWAQITAPGNRFTHLCALLFASVLPGSVLLSAYVTNELAVQIGMLGVVVVVVRFGFHKQRLYHISFALLVGMLCGLLLLTKLTALILVGVLAAWFWLGALRMHSFQLFRNGVLIVVVAGVIALPWQIYRQHAFGTAFTINNYEQQMHAQESQTLPQNFFTSFDTHIFGYPFWNTGSQSFFTMLYADTFADYQGILHNPDTVILLPEQDRMQLANQQIVSLRQARILRTMLYIALGLCAAYILGLVRLGAYIVRTHFKFTKELLVLLLSIGLLAALIYNVVQYPFLERGTLKTIFILVLMPLLAPYAFSFSRNKVYQLVIGTTTTAYAMLAALAFWI